MEHFVTTNKFVYRGQPYPGIPLFFDDQYYPIKVLNNYMLYLVFEQGSAESPLTWRSYADALLDYFCWLNANGLKWDDKPRMTKHGKEISNLALYQRWSAHDHRKPDGYNLANSTINNRVARIQFFYKWAKEYARLINFLPYVEVMKQKPYRHPDAFAHTHGKQYALSSNLKLPEKKQLPPVLSLEQCRELLACSISKTLKLMMKMMLGTGLRNEECRTFPRKYVFDPSGLDKSKRICISLDPRSMKLKGNKARDIYLSWQRMAALYEYTKYGEGVKRAHRYHDQFGVAPPLLFLQEQGQPWSENGLTNGFRKLWHGHERRGYKYPPVLSFKVTPHMLRHTYATMELYSERQKRGVGHALAWVRDRLGHSSIQTTTIYVHCLDLMEDQELNEWNQQLDRMMDDDK